eukprot:gene3205-3727_t
MGGDPYKKGNPALKVLLHDGSTMILPTFSALRLFGDDEFIDWQFYRDRVEGIEPRRDHMEWFADQVASEPLAFSSFATWSCNNAARGSTLVHAFPAGLGVARKPMVAA